MDAKSFWRSSLACTSFDMAFLAWKSLLGPVDEFDAFVLLFEEYCGFDGAELPEDLEIEGDGAGIAFCFGADFFDFQA